MNEKKPLDLTINNKLFDTLKWITLVALPAFGTLYFALAGIWELPFAEQVLGTLVALELFFGTLLGISNHSYKKLEKDIDGAVGVDWATGDLTGLEIDQDIHPNNKTLKLKVWDDSQ